MDEIFEKIMNPDKWPGIDFAETLELLNEVADESFEKQTFSGLLSSMLIYHQIIEAMCIHILKCCHFQEQLALYPTTIDFKIDENAMMGRYIYELSNTIDFYEKEEFLEEIENFNKIRNEIVHKMNKTNLSHIESKLKLTRRIFDNIYNLYDEIQDNFRVIFHDYQKDVFYDLYNEEIDEGK